MNPQTPTGDPLTAWTWLQSITHPDTRRARATDLQAWAHHCDRHELDIDTATPADVDAWTQAGPPELSQSTIRRQRDTVRLFYRRTGRWITTEDDITRLVTCRTVDMDGAIILLLETGRTPRQISELTGADWHDLPETIRDLIPETPDRQPLVRSEAGDPLTPLTITRRAKRLIHAAGLPQVTVQTIRDRARVIRRSDETA